MSVLLSAVGVPWSDALSLIFTIGVEIARPRRRYCHKSGGWQEPCLGSDAARSFFYQGDNRLIALGLPRPAESVLSRLSGLGFAKVAFRELISHNVTGQDLRCLQGGGFRPIRPTHVVAGCVHPDVDRCRKSRQKRRNKRSS